MTIDYHLELSSSVPLRTIDGVPNSIWTYTLTWSDQTSRMPVDPGPRLAITLSSRIKIQDPRKVPDVSAVQDTQLENAGTGDVQRVYRDIQGRVGNTLLFHFVAPSELDSFTAVRLSQRSPISAPWTDLHFRTSSQDGEPALQQVISGPAVVCPAGAPGPQSPLLPHSARTIEKATISSMLVGDTAINSLQAGNALAKIRFARQLLLQPGEVRSVQQHLAASPAETAPAADLSPTDPIWDLLALFEADPHKPSPPPPLTVLADVPLVALTAFGHAISRLRKRTLNIARQEVSDSAGTRRMPGGDSAPQAVRQRDLKVLSALTRAATIATKGLSINVSGRGVLPIGFMNLERLEMTPAGIVRGELIATIPLAPLEETAVVQKEWSVTSKEFTSIVTDSLENISETGVTDNTELAQSTTSQLKHSNQFNITGTVSGGIEHIFDASATSGFTAQDASSDSATASRKQSATVTQKASSRVKQEHKVTISTTTVTGASESTTRTLKNSDPQNPIRIDYFSMMREWRVRLYRYGLRLTYDLVIPEPGGTMRQAYAYLAWLRSRIGPFNFGVSHFPAGYVKSESDANYAAILKLADQYNAQIPPFPEAPAPITVSMLLQNDTNANAIADESLPPVDVPQGFWIENLLISIRLRNVGAALRVLFTGYPEKVCNSANGNDFGPDDLTAFGFPRHVTGNIVVRVSHHDCQNSGVQLEAVFSPTDQTINGWLNDVWVALYNAAQTQYYASQQDVATRISQLEDRLTNVDTLTLRREESEEIMKLAIASLVGTYTGHFWADLDAFAAMASPPPWPPIPDPADPFGATLDPKDISSSGVRGIGSAVSNVFSQTVYPLLPLVENEEKTTRFINQAIEWENVVTFLYSYFWDVPESWDFIRNLQHRDATRQAFLRAGSARVVLTVRRGWEEMWTTFVQTGVPYSTGRPDTIPYLSIAQEIAAYDDHNYPGIPPANPGQSAVRIEEAVYTTSTTKLNPPQPSPQDPNPPPLTEVEIEVASSVGFVVGAFVVIDSGVGEDVPPDNHGRQERTTITAIRATDTKHITLAAVQYPHGGEGYAVVQPGEKGVLIAEWNEYTPTSGTDIAVTSDLATIA